MMSRSSTWHPTKARGGPCRQLPRVLATCRSRSSARDMSAPHESMLRRPLQDFRLQDQDQCARQHKPRFRLPGDVRLGALDVFGLLRALSPLGSCLGMPTDIEAPDWRQHLDGLWRFALRSVAPGPRTRGVPPTASFRRHGTP